MRRKLPSFNFLEVPLIKLLIILLFVSPSSNSMAAKIDWSAGSFYMTSSTPTTQSSLKNSFGAFQISNRISILKQLEFGYGYSITYSKFFSGDYGYGPDIGVFYFPLTSAGQTDVFEGNIRVFRSEVYRPFLAVNFHARQFQSIEASYAGYSFGGGVEFWNYHPFGLRILVKQALFRGPQRSTAKELTILGGFSWEY